MWILSRHGSSIPHFELVFLDAQRLPGMIDCLYLQARIALYMSATILFFSPNKHWAGPFSLELILFALLKRMDILWSDQSTLLDSQHGGELY